MKKIHDIISSELVARVNNVNFRQEFGEVGKSSAITTEGNSTIFTTTYKIDKVVYVTVNGVNLIEGEHYTITSDFTISISNQGAPLRDLPGSSTNILIGYFFYNRRHITITDIKIPPTIETFYLNKYSGKSGEITFDFVINPNDGKNIYWSILKNGNEVPLFSGSSLKTTNSTTVDSSGNVVKLSYLISNNEYLQCASGELTFTLVVIYDLSQDGSRLDEKLMNSQIYRFVPSVPITGSITSTPAFIDSEGQFIINVNWSTLNPDKDNYEWQVTKTISGSSEIVLYSGSSYDNETGNFTEIIDTYQGDNYSIRYFLKVKSTIDSTFKTLSNDRTEIAVAAPVLKARAGYLDVAIMNYYDTSVGAWIKIGDLHLDRDRIEYNNRVPREIFTKEIDESYLTGDKFIQAPVYNPNGTISQVHFVIEVPNSWGDITFNQSLGEVDISSFNKIDLQNGYTAYLYKAAPSAVSNPADFFLKSK